MPINNRIAAFQDDMTAWRRDIHAHPELGFEEERTSDIVAAKLAEFGITVHRGLGGTGVVGTLKGLGTGSGRTIGLRADMEGGIDRTIQGLGGGGGSTGKGEGEGEKGGGAHAVFPP